ncbi:glycolipid transfer protein [Aphelenchoides avenae]|nr:glycolipid transfer protein [Aphelenchus avenae]
MANEVEVAEKETYFSHADRMFPDLEEGRIPTEQFLTACQGIADFVGFLGTAFAPVKADISGNVKKVRAKYETNPQEMPFLEDLIDRDLKEHDGKLGIATEGLLWLKRGLEFMLILLRSMVQDYRSAQKAKTENLVQTLKGAYEGSLKRHHGFFSQQIFKVVLHAAPYRKDILKAVAFGQPGLDDLCITHIETHLDGFSSNVNALVEYYCAKGLETRP